MTLIRNAVAFALVVATTAHPAGVLAKSLPTVNVRVTFTPDRQRVVGKALSADNGVLTLIAERRKDRTTIPLDSILRIETRGGGHSKLSAAAAGVGVGVATFFATFLRVIAVCGDENGPCLNRATPLVLGLPIAAGSAVGYLVRSKGWHPISLEQLRAALEARRP